MNQKRKNPQFRKSVDWDSVNNPKASNKSLNDPNVNRDKVLEKRYKAKVQLMNRYNMSEEEAELTLRRMERKAREERKKETDARKIKRFLEEDDDAIVPIHAQNTRNEVLEKPKVRPSYKNEAVKKEIYVQSAVEPALNSNIYMQSEDKPAVNSNEIYVQSEDKPAVNTENKVQDSSQIKDNHISKMDSSDNQNVKKPKQDVDSLISDLIPDYNKELSVEVNNISLTKFN